MHKLKDCWVFLMIVLDSMGNIQTLLFFSEPIIVVGELPLRFY